MNLLADFSGKYAAFIWPAYGASLLAFAWMIGDTVLRERRWRREARRLEGAREGSSLDAPGQQAADVVALQDDEEQQNR